MLVDARDRIYALTVRTVFLLGLGQPIARPASRNEIDDARKSRPVSGLAIR